MSWKGGKVEWRGWRDDEPGSAWCYPSAIIYQGRVRVIYWDAGESDAAVGSVVARVELLVLAKALVER
jgi:hypothetical protein